MPLQTFITGIHDTDEGSWSEPQIYAAESREEAARMAFKGWDEDRIADILAGVDVDYSIEPVSGYDDLVKGPGRVKMTIEDERHAGWGGDGESPCGCCGLYPCHMEKYRVCPECGNCAECGCDDDCPGYQPEEDE